MVTSIYYRWSVICKGCRTVLMEYGKRGSSKSQLVKILPSRILEDYTKNDGNCPTCDSTFARPFLYRGTPAWKLLPHKIIVRK